MDNTQLKCFITVAKTLNFSEAAKLNFVSQSTISRYIKDLEKEFGVKLFERTKREVSLTNEGKILLPYAEEILDTLNKANAVISQINKGLGGKISIGYDMISGEFVTKCLKVFNKKYPDISVDLTQVTGVNDLVTNTSDYDFYFIPRDLLPDNENVQSIVTHSDTLSFIASSNIKLTADEIKSQKFILLSENVNPILYMELMDIFRTFHFTPEKITTADDIHSVIMKVEAEMGVSVLPTSLAKNYQNSNLKVIESDDVETDIEFVMAWRKDFSNPVANLFLDIVEKQVEIDEEEEFVL